MENDLLLQIKQLKESLQPLLQQEQDILNRYSSCKQTLKNIEEIDIIKLYIQKTGRLTLVKKCKCNLERGKRMNQNDIKDLFCLKNAKLTAEQIEQLANNEFVLLSSQIAHLEVDDIVKSYLDCKNNLRGLVDEYCKVLQERQKNESELATCLRRISSDFERDF